MDSLWLGNWVKSDMILAWQRPTLELLITVNYYPAVSYPATGVVIATEIPRRVVSRNGTGGKRVPCGWGKREAIPDTTLSPPQ